MVSRRRFVNTVLNTLFTVPALFAVLGPTYDVERTGIRGLRALGGVAGNRYGPFLGDRPPEVSDGEPAAPIGGLTQDNGDVSRQRPR